MVPTERAKVADQETRRGRKANSEEAIAVTVVNQIGKKQRYGERITCRKTESQNRKHSERGACVKTILEQSVNRTVKQTLKGSLRGRAQRKQQETQKQSCLASYLSQGFQDLSQEQFKPRKIQEETAPRKCLW